MTITAREVNQSSPFVHLHVHSEFSRLRGVPSIDALCLSAKRQGADTLALTDTNSLHGAVRFVRAAQAANLRPILGAELTLGTHRAILLIKTADGYSNLCRLISDRHCDPAFDLTQAVRQYRHGLVIVSDDAQALRAWQDNPDDLFVEVTPGHAMHRAVALAHDLCLRPVATARAHMLRTQDYTIHRLLRAIADRSTLSGLAAEDCCAATDWLAPPPVLARQLSAVPEAIANTRRVADACQTDWEFREIIFPTFRQLADGEAFGYLRDKAYTGARKRYGRLRPAVCERLEYELEVIRDRRFAHYFLTVDEIVQRAPLTCGRGSGAASIVAYCLGITHVDPIQHRLFFERFLNPARGEPPDLDIDVPWDERDRLLSWTLGHYGPHRAAMVAAHNTFGLRGAVRDVARVYGMPPAEIDRVTAFVAQQSDILEVAESAAAQRWAASLPDALRLGDPWPEILNGAIRIAGHFRHTAVHCGGIVIAPDDIRRYVPVEIAAKGVPVIQWEKDQAEEAGLVKIDLLGNRSLSVIRDALAAVRQHTGRAIDYAAWDPVQDEATKNIIRRAETVGCFYVESPATRLLLRKLWTRMPADRLATADAFDCLVMVSSLVRQAAISFVHELIRRAHGSPYQPAHPSLAEMLADTYGIMVYQEDVTRVAMAAAGFSIAEADELRRVVSKKRTHRRLRDFCERFSRGAAARGASPPAIDAMWTMIMSFAGYSFCKPHSASYAQVSFKSAYLRAHFPAEFMAAVISNQGGYYSTLAYLSEARRMGLRILAPDVNESAWHYTGRDGMIRIGLMQLRGLPEKLGRRIVSAREEHGPFRSFDDLLRRVEPEPSAARLLVKAGCCDSIAGGLTRPALLWRLYAARSRFPASPPQQHDVSSGHGSLPAPREYDASTQLRHEFETLGFAVHHHPLDLYAFHMDGLYHVEAQDMGRRVGQPVTMVGWLVTEKLTQTKHGDPMGFVTFEDRTGLFEATFFPYVYRRFCLLLSEARPYVLEGVVEDDLGALTLTVKEIRRLDGRGYAAPGRAPKECDDEGTAIRSGIYS